MQRFSIMKIRRKDKKSDETNNSRIWSEYGNNGCAGLHPADHTRRTALQEQHSACSQDSLPRPEERRSGGKYQKEYNNKTIGQWKLQ